MAKKISELNALLAAAIADDDQFVMVDKSGNETMRLDASEAKILFGTASQIVAAADKATPVDADSFGIVDSAASNILKELTFTNLKAFLKTFFDGLYLSDVVDDASPELAGVLVGNGNDVIGIGVLTLVEQAAAEGDVAGRGQVWVKTATPNQPFYTDDDGLDEKIVLASEIVGKQTVGIPAGAMRATETNGAELVSVELPTNDVPITHFAFDDSTEEYVGFSVTMPKSWDGGTLIAHFNWYSDAAVTGNAIWGVQFLSIGDGDPIDAAYGTGIEVTDTASGTAKDNNKSPDTAAITASGSNSPGDVLHGKIYRKAADGSDTLVGDALLTELRFTFGTNAATDD